MPHSFGRISPPTGPIGRPVTPPDIREAGLTQAYKSKLCACPAHEVSRLDRDVDRLTGRSAHTAFSPSAAQPVSAVGALATVDDLSVKSAENPLAGSSEGVSVLFEKTAAAAASLGGAGLMGLLAGSLRSSGKVEKEE